MSLPVVYAKSSLSTSSPTTGLIVRLKRGEPWWADDPLVKARPELFEVEPSKPRSTVRIETTTSAPGEKRRTK